VIQEIPDREYGFMEWHASAFAGLVLVPDALIEEQISRCEEIIDRHYPGARAQPEAFQEFLAECLGKELVVSPEVAIRRLRNWNELKW
jgi:hypothetical protein